LNPNQGTSNICLAWFWNWLHFTPLSRISHLTVEIWECVGWGQVTCL
jgi:hypothetical protein